MCVSHHANENRSTSMNPVWKVTVYESLFEVTLLTMTRCPSEKVRRFVTTPVPPVSLVPGSGRSGVGKEQPGLTRQWDNQPWVCRREHCQHIHEFRIRIKYEKCHRHGTGVYLDWLHYYLYRDVKYNESRFNNILMDMWKQKAYSSRENSVKKIFKAQCNNCNCQTGSRSDEIQV